MKRGTPRHPKTKALARALKIPIPYAAGLLATLWDYVSDFCPDGGIGRLSDEEIADACGWPVKKSAMLIEALTAEHSRWLDRMEGCRLYVHDWQEHCEDLVHRKLARAGLIFADGTIPKMTRLTDKERAQAEKIYAQRAHEMRPTCALPLPEPEPEPEPSSTVHATNSTPNKRGPLAAAVTQLLGKTLAEPLPRNGAVRHTREALAAQTGEIPPEQLVGRIVQEARQVDAEISDEEVALWVHGCAPEGADRGAAWFAAAVVAHIRERPREVATLREFVQGKAPPAEADALLRERGIPPRLRNALRAWRLQHSEEIVENKIA